MWQCFLGGFFELWQKKVLGEFTVTMMSGHWNLSSSSPNRRFWQISTCIKSWKGTTRWKSFTTNTPWMVEQLNNYQMTKLRPTFTDTFVKSHYTMDTGSPLSYSFVSLLIQKSQSSLKKNTIDTLMLAICLT